ncbi:hypothetical protein IG631_02266 [Alternaria alternata]|nr:hypothetical protein IG631_02266 [Alternaria alternata]
MRHRLPFQGIPASFPTLLGRYHSAGALDIIADNAASLKYCRQLCSLHRPLAREAQVRVAWYSRIRGGYGRRSLVG